MVYAVFRKEPELIVNGSASPEIRKASPTIPSWNQILDALRQLERLRRSVAA